MGFAPESAAGAGCAGECDLSNECARRRFSGYRSRRGESTVRNSIVTGKRLSLSRRIPGVLSPERLQRDVVAAKNVAFSFSNVGYRFRKQAPRSQIAFTIATVLPHTPGAPGPCVPRLGMIVSDPQPAIRQCLAV